MPLALPSTTQLAAPPAAPRGLVRRAQVAGSAAAALTPRPVATLEVGADDDVATLHSRLERAANRRLTLALAPDVRVLRRPLDFRVLRRLAEELTLDLTIATDESQRRRMAREFGFPVQAPRLRRPRWRVAPRRLVGGAATAAILAVSLVGLPRTQVSINPAAVPLTREATVTVDLRSGAPGVSAGWIASTTLATTFEIEQSAPTSGRLAIGHTPATGYVTFQDLRPYVPPAPAVPAPSVPAIAMAALHTIVDGTITLPIQLLVPEVQPPPPPQPERVIPTGTVVTTPDGQRFFTQAEARLTPSGYVLIPVVAESAGRGGNVPAGAIDRLGDPKVDAADLRIENRQPTYGGTDRQERIVASGDRDGLKQALQDRAAAEAPARLFAAAGTDFVIVPETVTWRLEEHFDFGADQRATHLNGRGLVRAQGIAVPNRALEEVGRRAWREDLPAGLGSVGAPHVAGAPVLQEQGDHHLIVSLPMQGKVAPRLDTEALAEQFRGQPTEAIRTHLANLPGLRDKPRVEMWPAWAPAALRVDVVVASAR